jgi:hypothetical protein
LKLNKNFDSLLRRRQQLKAAVVLDCGLLGRVKTEKGMPGLNHERTWPFPRIDLIVQSHEDQLKLNKVVDSFPRLGRTCSLWWRQVWQGQRAEGMPGSNHERMFWLNEGHSLASI